MFGKRKRGSEFEELFRRSIGADLSDETPADPFAQEAEDIYTPSNRRRGNENAPPSGRRGQSSRAAQDWNQNISSDFYGIKDNGAAEPRERAAGIEAPGSESGNRSRRPSSRRLGGSSGGSWLRQPMSGIGVVLVAVSAVISVLGLLMFKEARKDTGTRAMSRRVVLLEQSLAALDKAGDDKGGIERRVQGIEDKLAQVHRELAAIGGTIEHALAPVERDLRAVLAGQTQRLDGIDGELEKLAAQLDDLREASAGQPASTEAADNLPAPAVPQEDWVVNLITVARADYAAQLETKYRAAGVQAKRQEITVAGKKMFRLGVSGFASEAEARNYAAEVGSNLGLKGVWLMHR